MEDSMGRERGRILNYESPFNSAKEWSQAGASAFCFQEKIDTLERLQSETEKEIEQISQSILTKAFRGGL